MRENYLYRGVKGMRDVFPAESRRFQALESLARKWFSVYGFGEIRTPLLELSALFERGVGQGTDIVNKEMFYVPAKAEEGEGAGRMVLRPEATAAVVRAYVEHEIDKSAPGVQKYYYLGPMFRYERPQRGRLRQFTQIGIEMLGTSAPAADAECMLLLVQWLQAAGLPDIELKLNSVGCQDCRPGYLEVLRGFVRDHDRSWCLDCRERSEKNPLRLFDCKQPGCSGQMASAPLLQNHLCAPCRQHQVQLLALLTRVGAVYALEPRLVRGLDYYTRTVFEITSARLGAQNAVAGGGRYDRLVAELGGPATPAFGWSAGVERLLEILPPLPAAAEMDVLIVAAGPDPEHTFMQVTALRQRGLRVGFEHDSRSVKALMKRADRLGAKFALFVSADDPLKIEIKDLQTGVQQTITWETLADRIQLGG